MADDALQDSIESLWREAREVPAERLRGRVRVLSTGAVADALRRLSVGGDGDAAARLAALESERDQLEAETRRSAERIGLLESRLRAAGEGGSHGAPAEGATATEFLDLAEQPDYAGIMAELEEARESLGRVEEKLGGSGGEGVRQLATAILRALGDEDETAAAAPGASIPGVDAIRSRLESIERELQRDGSALSILFEAMADGNGTVAVVTELLTLVARDHGFAGEIRTLRSALGLLDKVAAASASSLPGTSAASDE